MCGTREEDERAKFASVSVPEESRGFSQNLDNNFTLWQWLRNLWITSLSHNPSAQLNSNRIGNESGMQCNGDFHMHNTVLRDDDSIRCGGKHVDTFH
jgi:hypothetical protein